MAPIYDSDIAEERWAKEEWSRYELWEKVELKLRRHKRLWIAGTVLVFLGLSSIPLVIEQRPKWRALSASRQLAQQINSLKKEASLEHLAFRIAFRNDGTLSYDIDKGASCAAIEAGQATRVREGELRSTGEPLQLLDRQAGESAGIPGLQTSLCYDPVSGAPAGAEASGFALIPARDLTEKRTDRVSVLLVSGPSAELSFE